MKPDEHDEIYEALLDAGVHEGFPSERRKLVSVLMTADVTAAQVRRLWEWCQRTKAKNPSASLASMLSKPEQAKEALADIEAVAARRGGPQAAASGQAAPIPREDWREADIARRVRARIDSDRRKPAEVAAEFGLAPGEVERLLEVGRGICLCVKGEPLRQPAESVR